MLTTRRTVIGDVAGRGGYRPLRAGPAEPHRYRADLHPRPAVLGESLLAVAHVSDIHVCDAQSPARAEFLDRWMDPDSPMRESIEEIGTYRAQEILTAQVAEAMVQAINGLVVAPCGGRPLDLVIATGDSTDNAQANELAWYLALLEGGPVRPDSGDLARYEGVNDEVEFDERFWHPDSARSDLPRSRNGFPAVPGLLNAVRAPFTATGLRLPWLAAHGNHDHLLQGTVPAAGGLAQVATGTRKPIGLPAELSPDAVGELLAGLADCDPAALSVLARARSRIVTPDPDRRVVGPAEFVAAHFGPRANPCGHGFAADRRPYYRHDPAIDLTFLVLDTVNPYGGWQGSLDRAQLDWLAGELAAADRDRRYVVLASHHPLDTLTNATVIPDAPRRVLRDELARALAGHPSLVLWLNGHTHRSAVTPRGTWWEVTAPSLIDWPQQARIVEVLRGGGSLTIATTMLDHGGQPHWDGHVDRLESLAGLSRELAANDWQWRDRPLEHHSRAGTANDRNALLYLADPWA